MFLSEGGSKHLEVVMCLMYIILFNPTVGVGSEEGAIIPSKAYMQKVKQFLCDFGLRKDFLDTIPKAQYIKQKLIRFCQNLKL